METIQGVRTKLVLVSYSHGAVRVPLAQSFNYTPKITEREINEFDNLEVAAIVTNFTGVDMTFDYLDSDSKLVEAMFADEAPNASVIVDDPSNYKLVNLYANMRGLETGTIFGCVLAKGCRTKGAPYTEPILEEAKVTRDLTGTNVLKIKGAAMYYQRILAETPDESVFEQVVPPCIGLDLKFAMSPGGNSGYSGYSGASGYSGYNNWEVTNAKTALLFGTSYAVMVLKNGVEVDTGFVAWPDRFVVTDTPLDTDIWEVFYLFDDTVEA